MQSLPLSLLAGGLNSPNCLPRIRVEELFFARSKNLSIGLYHKKPLFPTQFGRVAACYVTKTAIHDHQDDQELEHDHNHQHHGNVKKLSKSQEAFVGFAKAIGWSELANYLREHLQLCGCSMALFVAAAACPYLVPKPAVRSLQNVFILVAFPLVGVSASLDALTDIVGRKVNIHVLMALAAFASIFMGNSLEGGLLLAMFNMAHITEEYVTSRSKIDVKKLKEKHPDFALVINVSGDGISSFSDLSCDRVPVHDVEVGAHLLIRTGEPVPVDCEVCHGRSTITMKHLTGEVKPVERKVGDRIPGGAKNLQDGMMIVKVTKTWKESTVNRIMQLTEEAHLNKPKLQRWVDEFGERYSKVVVLLSVAVALVGPFLFKWPFVSTSVCRGSIYRALGLMVAASPCAFSVAPLVYAIAISSCARKGILLKGGHVLDALTSCHTIAFDKTGTLTSGTLSFIAVEPIYGHGMGKDKSNLAFCCVPSCEEEALAVAAAMEKGTTHPIGRAVVEYSTGKDLPSVSVESFQFVPGRGLTATLNRLESGNGMRELFSATLGSVDYITSLCKSEDESEKIREAVRASSYGRHFVNAALSVNEKVTLFHLEDKARPGVSNVIEELQYKANLHVLMLTGDHESSALRVAKAVGIKEVYCCLKPEDKLNHIKSISSVAGGAIMVGDGINDAPALAAATVGIVLAQRASATAVAFSDALLLQDNLSGIPYCIATSRQISSLVKQNVALALSSIFLASLPSVLGFLPLWLTVLLHEGGTLLVCLNSMRALNDPAWSPKQDFLQSIKSLRYKPSQGTTEASPL